MICESCSGTCKSKGYSRGRRRWRCGGCGQTGYFEDEAPKGDFELPAEPLPVANTYVFTYAQNATPVAASFFASLKQFCEYTGAQLVVLPGNYHNPTSQWSEHDRSQQWWARELHPYLNAGRNMVGEHLEIRGDVSIQPTAVRPLTGMTYGKPSGLFGHPKREWQTVAGSERYYPRVFTTTGAVTVPNYTKSRAGKRAAEFHALGACVVTLSAGLFHLRHITAAEAGSFTDGLLRFSGKSEVAGVRPKALVLGDLHAAKLSVEDVDRTLKLVDALGPECVILHDVLDFESRSHHTRDRFWEKHKRIGGGALNSVLTELEYTCNLVAEIASKRQVVVVASNHDEMLEKWLLDTKLQDDPVNAKAYVELWSLWLDNPGVPLLGTFYRTKPRPEVRFLKRNESFKVHDIECGYHFDKGTNGSRGSLAQYAKLGIRCVGGHSHTPGIQDHAHQTGHTGRADHGYNDLPSAWLSTHEVIYQDGQRTLFNVIDGKTGWFK